MHLRRLLVLRDVVYADGGSVAPRPVTRVVAAAVILNPFARMAQEDLSELFRFGDELGALLVREAMAALPAPAVAYGKSAIVGIDGELEHGAAVIHPRMGGPIRKALGGGKAVIPSNTKVAACGTGIDIPLSHRDDAWSFDHIDTVTAAIPDAPRANEIAIFVALSDGGRPWPRMGSPSTVPSISN